MGPVQVMDSLRGSAPAPIGWARRPPGGPHEGACVDRTTDPTPRPGRLQPDRPEPPDPPGLEPPEDAGSNDGGSSSPPPPRPAPAAGQFAQRPAEPAVPGPDREELSGGRPGPEPGLPVPGQGDRAAQPAGGMPGQDPPAPKAPTALPDRGAKAAPGPEGEETALLQEGRAGSGPRGGPVVEVEGGSDPRDGEAPVPGLAKVEGGDGPDAGHGLDSQAGSTAGPQPRVDPGPEPKPNPEAVIEGRQGHAATTPVDREENSGRAETVAKDREADRKNREDQKIREPREEQPDPAATVTAGSEAPPGRAATSPADLGRPGHGGEGQGDRGPQVERAPGGEQEDAKPQVVPAVVHGQAAGKATDPATDRRSPGDRGSQTEQVPGEPREAADAEAAKAQEAASVVDERGVVRDQGAGVDTDRAAHGRSPVDRPAPSPDLDLEQRRPPASPERDPGRERPPPPASRNWFGAEPVAARESGQRPEQEGAVPGPAAPMARPAKDPPASARHPEALGQQPEAPAHPEAPTERPAARISPEAPARWPEVPSQDRESPARRPEVPAEHREGPAVGLEVPSPWTETLARRPEAPQHPAAPAARPEAPARRPEAPPQYPAAPPRGPQAPDARPEDRAAALGQQQRPSRPLDPPF